MTRARLTEDVRAAVRDAVRGTVRSDEELAPHTSWRVGGPADLWVEPADVDDLRAALAVFAAHEVPWIVLGKGSNVLVADAGVRGAVLNLEEGLRELRHEVDALGPGVHRLVAGAGAAIAGVLHYVVRHQIEGLELWTGIPGTVGGAVVMNAGTHLGETKDALLDATIMGADGAVSVRDAAALGLSYRHSALRAGEVVVGATFRVRTALDSSFAQVIQETKARRRATQPVTLPSGGSTFANPPGDHAWRLVDAAGLRGHVIGGAQISELHPNFIVNLGDATAADIAALMRLAMTEVEQRFGVRLRPEVVRVGEWEGE
ncbi:MAG: UDP-N-acetylenolpyruvoylglucosamine reductase [Myxococcales bacterium]